MPRSSNAVGALLIFTSLTDMVILCDVVAVLNYLYGVLAILD